MLVVIDPSTLILSIVNLTARFYDVIVSCTLKILRWLKLEPDSIEEQVFVDMKCCLQKFSEDEVLGEYIYRK